MGSRERLGLGHRGLPDAEGDSGNIGFQHSEVLDPASVEVRFGDPMVDAPRLLELFTQSTTIEHLEGIVLSPYIYIDPSTREEKVMPATTVEDIRKMYKEGQQRLTLLTAEAPSGLIVGTYTVQKPGFGSLVAEGMRLVVDENYRNLRIAEKLVKAANAVMFGKGDGSGEFGCNKSQIYVIIGIDGDEIPQRAFAREGYLRGPENLGCTFSWSNEFNKLVVRNSQPMSLYRESYSRNRLEEQERYFPKERPARSV